MDRGKIVILGMVLLGLLGAGTAWIRRYYEDDQVRERFGPHAVALIATAPEATAICRVGDSEKGRTNVSKALGFSNIRYMLGRDFAYRLDSKVAQSSMMLPTPWAIKFDDGGSRVTIGFSYDCRTAYLEDGGSASAELVDAAATDLSAFFHEQFAAESKSVDEFWKRDK